MSGFKQKTLSKTSRRAGSAGSSHVEARKQISWRASRSLWISILLVGVTLAVYWPVTGFDFINYDDNDYVSENHHVLGGLTWRGVVWAFSTGQTGNWHPLTWISHMADGQFFGAHAG